jgi:hypothetical protein
MFQCRILTEIKLWQEYHAVQEHLEHQEHQGSNMTLELIPIEYDHGMSVITLLVISGIITAGCICVSYFWNKQNDTESKICVLNKTINDILIGNARIESRMDSTYTIVEKMERNMSELAKTNQQMIINSLKT